MPIYAYKCAACGHQKDVLQKVSDPVLTTCPACGAESFTKQVTAAGFQLKGSGWYVTDFRDGGKKSGGDAKADAKAEPKGDAKAGDAAAPAAAPAPAAASAAPAPASASPAPAPAASPPPSSGSR